MVFNSRDLQKVSLTLLVRFPRFSRVLPRPFRLAREPLNPDGILGLSRGECVLCIHGDLHGLSQYRIREKIKVKKSDILEVGKSRTLRSKKVKFWSKKKKFSRSKNGFFKEKRKWNF